MTPAELEEFHDEISVRHASTMEEVLELDPAPTDSETDDTKADTYAEALFLRSFAIYESDVERLFLHYVTGGTSLGGDSANTYLRVTDMALARKLTRAGWKFLSWSKPQEIRTTADTYIEEGWPISDIMNAKSQELSDCERIRNRIAHRSIESLQQFNVVQRNLLHTERLFPISPGQLLRIRNSRLRKLHIGHYLDVMTDTLVGIIDPPQ